MRRLAYCIPLVLLLVLIGNPVQSRAVLQGSESQILLEASKVAFTDVIAMCSAGGKDRRKSVVFHRNSIELYDERRNSISSIETLGVGDKFYPVDPGVDSSGNIYFINAGTDDIVKLTARGEWREAFRAEERPYSLAVLSNGNLVIASPNNGKLLHMYDPQGRKLRSFGDIRFFDRTNQAQNLFLNRGKVVVDASDNVYFVHKYAPSPEILKFTKKGRPVFALDLEGKAVGIQLAHARRYLQSKPSQEVGSIVISNSAAIDRSTGHLFICLNGSSDSAVVYEYTSKGKKFREYSFVSVITSGPRMLTFVDDIVSRNGMLEVVVDNIAYSVSADEPVSVRDYVFPQDTCPGLQPWGGCAVNCIDGSCPARRDCKQALESVVGEGPYVVGSTCSSLGPNQGTPPKPNGGCKATVTTCNVNTGIQTTVNADLDCNPVKYTCSNHSCVIDCSGTFTTANCNNTCGTDEDGDGYYAETDDCDDGDPEVHPGASISAYCGGPAPEGSTDNNCNGIDDWTEACTPILIDMYGNGFSLTSAAAGVDFDLSSDGIKERLAWTTANSDDAWLVMDRNLDGRINNGTELFGNFTSQSPSANPNGFIALAEYDHPEKGGNLDGRIDSRDAVFSKLRLWQDINRNGNSEPNELYSLNDLGLRSIDLDYSEVRMRDRFGNWFRYRARVKDTSGNQLERGRTMCA